jgi:hypothetical protein
VLALGAAGFYFLNSSSKATAAGVPPPLQQGSLLFEARLEGTSSDIYLPRTFRGAADASSIAFVPGAIKGSVRSSGAATSATFHMAQVSSYQGELDLRVTPGSNLDFYWVLQWPQPRDSSGQHGILVDTRRSEMTLYYKKHGVWTPERLTAAVALPGLAQGQAFTIGAKVDGSSYTLYLNHKQVATYSDNRDVGPGIPQFGLAGGTGTVEITGARFFTLLQ